MRLSADKGDYGWGGPPQQKDALSSDMRTLLYAALEVADLAWHRTDDKHMEGLAFNLRYKLKEALAICFCPTAAGGGNADDVCLFTHGECKARSL